MRILEVVEYDPGWRDEYDKESMMLSGIFAGNLVDIQHIGSTAVPGMRAKPTIDIIVSVHNLSAVDAREEEMAQAGYEAHGEYGIPGRRFFSKAEPVSGEDWVNIFHVHVFHSSDSYSISRHIAVRDFLRANGEKAEKYGALKSRLAESHPNDPESYSKGKEKFVQELEKEAVDWYSSGGSLP